MIAEKSMRANLRAAFRAASPDALSAGMNWYAEGGAFVALVAGLSGHTPEQIAAATAHLSPRTPWARNKRMVLELVETGATRGLGRSIRAARAALESSDPLATVNGPKTSAFARNLLGDFEPVTVDVWAYRAACPTGNVERMGIREYRAIARAYRDTARFFDVSPAQFQAVIWCHIRGTAI